MPFVCCKCPVGKNEHPRGITYFRNGEMVEYCRVHDPANRALMVAARNTFEGFTVQNVHDENHKPIKVNSLKELREKEKQYNFYLNCATDDNGDTSKAPQHEPWAGDLRHGYTKKWNRNPEAYETAESKRGLSTGVAMSPKDTLADHPNPV
jgi:hypothetical protein